MENLTVISGSGERFDLFLSDPGVIRQAVRIIYSALEDDREKGSLRIAAALRDFFPPRCGEALKRLSAADAGKLAEALTLIAGDGSSENSFLSLSSAVGTKEAEPVSLREFSPFHQKESPERFSVADIGKTAEALTLSTGDGSSENPIFSLSPAVGTKEAEPVSLSPEQFFLLREGKNFFQNSSFTVSSEPGKEFSSGEKLSLFQPENKKQNLFTRFLHDSIIPLFTGKKADSEPLREICSTPLFSGTAGGTEIQKNIFFTPDTGKEEKNLQAVQKENPSSGNKAEFFFENVSGVRERAIYGEEAKQNGKAIVSENRYAFSQEAAFGSSPELRTQRRKAKEFSAVDSELFREKVPESASRTFSDRVIMAAFCYKWHLEYAAALPPELLDRCLECAGVLPRRERQTSVSEAAPSAEEIEKAVRRGREAIRKVKEKTHGSSGL